MIGSSSLAEPSIVEDDVLFRGSPDRKLCASCNQTVCSPAPPPPQVEQPALAHEMLAAARAVIDIKIQNCLNLAIYSHLLALVIFSCRFIIRPILQ